MHPSPTKIRIVSAFFAFSALGLGSSAALAESTCLSYLSTRLLSRPRTWTVLNVGSSSCVNQSVTCAGDQWNRTADGRRGVIQNRVRAGFGSRHRLHLPWRP